MSCSDIIPILAFILHLLYCSNGFVDSLKKVLKQGITISKFIWRTFIHYRFVQVIIFIALTTKLVIFSWFYGMRIVITKYSFVVLIMKRKVITDTVRTLFCRGDNPRLNPPPIPIVTMYLLSMHT